MTTTDSGISKKLKIALLIIAGLLLVTGLTIVGLKLTKPGTGVKTPDSTVNVEPVVVQEPFEEEEESDEEEPIVAEQEPVKEEPVAEQKPVKEEHVAGQKPAKTKTTLTRKQGTEFLRKMYKKYPFLAEID